MQHDITQWVVLLIIDDRLSFRPDEIKHLVRLPLKCLFSFWCKRKVERIQLSSVERRTGAQLLLLIFFLFDTVKREWKLIIFQKLKF